MHFNKRQKNSCEFIDSSYMSSLIHNRTGMWTTRILFSLIQRVRKAMDATADGLERYEALRGFWIHFCCLPMLSYAFNALSFSAFCVLQRFSPDAVKAS